MPVRTCCVPHCTEPTSSQFSHHCQRHKSVLRRHGDALQTGVGKTELAPFRARVVARMEKNRESPLWPQLDAVWAEIVADARREAGRRVGNRYLRSAGYEVLNIDADALVREIVTTTLAMFVFWHDRPSRFRTDDAFRLQLARRVRALSGRHTGRRYDHQTGTEKRIYREMTPKAGIILGQKLSVAFGAAGFQLALLDGLEREEEQKAKKVIASAIRELK